MKLYATITSERASKGQGGKFLEISIFNENKKELWRIKVEPDIEFNLDGNKKTTKLKIFDATKSVTGEYGYVYPTPLFTTKS